MIINHLGRNVGILKHTGVFVTYRKEKHIFHKFDGIGVSVDVLYKIKRLGCYKVVIILHMDSGIDKKFEAKPDDFFEHGKVWKDGYDYQRILPFSFFNQKILPDCLKEESI